MEWHGQTFQISSLQIFPVIILKANSNCTYFFLFSHTITLFLLVAKGKIWKRYQTLQVHDCISKIHNGDRFRAGSVFGCSPVSFTEPVKKSLPSNEGRSSLFVRQKGYNLVYHMPFTAVLKSPPAERGVHVIYEPFSCHYSTINYYLLVFKGWME